MRKFNFNNFSIAKNRSSIEPESIKPLNEAPPKHTGAYRTIISRHEAVNAKLKDEPVAVIENNN